MLRTYFVSIIFPEKSPEILEIFVPKTIFLCSGLETVAGNNADVNASRHTGDTPPCVAAQDEHTEVVKLLGGNTADVIASRHTDVSSPVYVAPLQRQKSSVMHCLRSTHYCTGPQNRPWAGKSRKLPRS